MNLNELKTWQKKKKKAYKLLQQSNMKLNIKKKKKDFYNKMFERHFSMFSVE